MVTTPLSLETRTTFEDQLRARLREIYGANPWIVAVDIEQGAVRQAGEFRATGDQPVLAVGVRPGVGPLDETIPLLSLNLPDAGSMGANMHSAGQALADPPQPIRDAVDAWDPDGRALVVGGLTATAGELFGRRLFGARPTEWLALEDKLAIEALWVDAGVPVSPSAQVDATDEELLLAAHRELASALGTAWALDNTKGWHGGAQGTFWVPDEAAALAKVQDLAGYRQVRIMPFLEGVPCSIHGMVLPPSVDGSVEVAAFRPCEMMMVRDSERRRIVYGRVSNFWDPKPADRVAMQDAARRIGSELHRTVGYRGVFTVDGVMTVDGFRPTEVNTRYGAALPSLMDTVSGPPIQLYQVHLALVDGLLDDIDLSPIEHWVTANLDRTRRSLGYLETSRVPDGERRAMVVRADNGRLAVTELVEADAVVPDDAVAEVTWGVAPTGGLMLLTFKNGLPVGSQTAPVLLEVASAIDHRWQVGLAKLVAAASVR